MGRAGTRHAPQNTIFSDDSQTPHPPTRRPLAHPTGTQRRPHGPQGPGRDVCCPFRGETRQAGAVGSRWNPPCAPKHDFLRPQPDAPSTYKPASGASHMSTQAAPRPPRARGGCVLPFARETAPGRCCPVALEPAMRPKTRFSRNTASRPGAPSMRPGHPTATHGRPHARPPGARGDVCSPSRASRRGRHDPP